MGTYAAPAPSSTTARVKGLAAAGRLPFLSVGILPYVLGAVIARSEGVAFAPAVFWLGLAGVVLIMLATYFNGEYADIIEDRVSTDLGRNPFAGGGGSVIDGTLGRNTPFVAGLVATGLAVVDGLLLAFVFDAGVWTIPLGVFGLLCGYFYSMPPLRWVERGIGELMIGVCYGWLPVAVGYYLQADTLPAAFLWWVSLPVAFTIFNVIYVNEYPDYEGDIAAGKRNLLARIGRERGVFVYVAAALAAPATYVLALQQGLPSTNLVWYFAVVAVNLVPAVMLLAGLWRKREMLVPICGLTIVANLATTSVLISAFWAVVR